MLTTILGGLVVFFLVAAFVVATCLRRVVPTNFVHIVQSSKATTPYGRGKAAGNTYYAWPAWLPVLGVSVLEFPESNFQVALSEYEAYDLARLPFMVDVVAFFRVEKAEVAAQRVSRFADLQRDLQAVLQGSVRRILATNNLESIMQARSELGQQFTEEVKEQIEEWGVTTVKTVEFMDLRDTPKSQVIANIMAKEQSRIDMESRVRVAENKKAAQLAEIDAVRTVEVQKQDAEEQVGIRTATKDKTVGMAKETARQEVLTVAKVTAERDMDVRKVNEVRQAEISRDVAAVGAEQNKQVAIVNAEAEKETKLIHAEADKMSRQITAEGDKQFVSIRAEGDLTAALKHAEGVRAEGLAQADADKAKLMAPVEAQIQLAKEIGANPDYQEYLVTIEKIRAGKEVGLETARAMQKAELKVFANTGDVQEGIGKLGDVFSPKGGFGLSSMIANLAQTEEGKALVDRLTGTKPVPAAQ